MRPAVVKTINQNDLENKIRSKKDLYELFNSHRKGPDRLI